jgi:hypothetical protein
MKVIVELDLKEQAAAEKRKKGIKHSSKVAWLESREMRRTVG